MKFYEVTSPPNIVIILCEILRSVGLGLVIGEGGVKISIQFVIYLRYYLLFTTSFTLRIVLILVPVIAEILANDNPFRINEISF